jgi:hypothetical protein
MEAYIPCSGKDPGVVEEREALRGAVLKYAPHPVVPWPVSVFHHYTTNCHACVVSNVCINCVIGFVSQWWYTVQQSNSGTFQMDK